MTRVQANVPYRQRTIAGSWLRRRQRGCPGVEPINKWGSLPEKLCVPYILEISVSREKRKATKAILACPLTITPTYCSSERLLRSHCDMK